MTFSQLTAAAALVLGAVSASAANVVHLSTFFVDADQDILNVTATSTVGAPIVGLSVLGVPADDAISGGSLYSLAFYSTPFLSGSYTLSLETLAGAGPVTLSAVGTDALGVTKIFAMSPVPEPAGYSLALAGLAGLSMSGFLTQRRRLKAA